MGRKDANKPRGKMSSYAFFVQTCREEHKKKHPGESVVFAEFSRKCAEKWKTMSAKDKKRFEEMAEKDKARFEGEMSNYTPAAGDKKSRKRKKDPNAPKRALSAFFFFCNEERPSARAKMPGASVGEIAKELGRRWETCKDKEKFEKMAAEDRKRYEKECAAYKKSGGASAPAPKKTKAAAPPPDDDDDDEEEDDEEEEEDEDDDDDE